MPIKIPGFGRRKSGPVLDETPPPEPSFRVFERPPHRASHSFDSVSALKKSPATDDPDPDNIFAGIQKPAPASSSTSHVPGTAVSARTGKLAGSSNGSSSKPYDSSSTSSARYSSSSTLPSSTDHSPHDAIPVPPIPESPFSFSIRASGRTVLLWLQGLQDLDAPENSRDSLIAADDFTLSQKLANQLQNVELNESSRNNARATAAAAAASSMPNSRSTPNIYSSDRDRFRDPEVSSLFSSDKDFSAVPRQPYYSSSSFRKNMPPSASMNSHYASSLASSKTGNKVMTPAQFERYQQQQAQKAPSEPSSDEEDEVDSEDDEDETEKRKQAAAQRQKQEAHLSVYRQQMMKITGEQKKASTNGPAGSAESVAGNPNRRSVLDPMEVANSNISNNSTNNTNNNLNINTASSSPGVSPGLPPGVGLSKSSPSDGEEDDDVPLGILAAHGFPHRNRPPTHLAASRSNPNLNASFQSGAASIAGMQEGPSKRSTLPVFARNLPKDPYYGSSLVNPSHLHTNFLAPQPQMQMGGLLGQLQQHQQAQAGMVSGMNTNGLIGGAGTVNPHHHHHPFPQGGSVGGPADQTQMQVSQQMTNMMQMQMQWMQQMMQMQGAQQQHPPPPGGPMPNLNMNASSASLLQPPNPNQRPFSMASTSTPSQFRGPPQVDHRTLSMLDPSTTSIYQNPGNRASFLMTPDMSGPSLGMGMGMGMGMGGGLGSGPAPGYTPSVAPSERSNVGAASRYRPVSTIAAQANGANRSSTFTAHTLRPWAEERPPPLGQILANKSSTNLSATTPSTSETTPTVRPVTSMNRRTSPMGLGNGSRGSIAGLPATPGAGEQDEDDEQGWAEMMKNREKKKTGWKFRRGGARGHDGSLSDYVHPTAI
ncbi:hypothetical protein TEQG_00378 [Trichophyton equinum CBS 127.97]|uniref:Uncharacterized protein n=1 Tax=Trichophyton equinum (strain ATCC MYA-4606 / CBS 127.97) TaxID=559882 RepID=F2PHF7_TRIEC|nr:hypothetical protein TEQG_00378 [Trichophyton equinum CBS 127.97]